jgi:cell pole-organizing protein PopZ
VEDEQSKVGMGSSDLIDAAAEQDGDEDVLELSAADMVGAPAAKADEADELIDIAAFAASGEAKPVNGETAAALAADILGEMGATPAAEAPTEAAPQGGAADEFDRLLAEISQEQQQNVAAAEVSKQALMDEEEPLGTEANVENDMSELTEAVQAEAIAAATADLGGIAAGTNFALSSVQGPEGMQIAFPAEVLAMALRPMVQEWLSKNLPGVVEKLVKEEISKLTQN